MTLSGLTMVCFALEQEAAPLRRLTKTNASCRILITGVGPDNASRAIQAALDESLPAQVLSCGFAGGLSPELGPGSVVYEADEGSALAGLLRGAGARAVRFACVHRIASTAAEKAKLRQSSGADAVEMESGTIRAVCRQRGLVSATIRVITDTAGEDLPFDFNQLMNARFELDYLKLASTLLRSPGKTASLFRLQRRARTAAENLAAVLLKVLGRQQGFP